MPDALPMPLPAPQPAPRGIAWIDAATAAKRLGVSARQVTHRCGDEWFALGLARLDGPKWFVREDADPMLARVTSPEHLALDLRQLPAQQRRDVLERLEVLNEWKAQKAAAVVAGRPERSATAEFLRALELSRDYA